MSVFSSALMNADLLATCHSLGSWEQKEYIKEPDCLESIKDLIRFLRRDDDTHGIRRQLGIIRVLETDLLPLLKYYPNENALFEVNLRILVNITNPALLLYHEELPEEKTTRNQYLEVVGHLQMYKQAFVDAKVWAVLTKRLGDLLQLTWEHRQEEDKTTIERILILVRNVLHVPANPTEEKRTDDDVSVHDQILWVLHQSGMEDLLLYIATSEEEDQFCFHILEIISLMFREQKAEQLALSGSVRPESEKEKDIKELMNIRDQEKAEKKVNQLKLSGRHSRFGGTFCVRNVKSVSDRDLICHRILADNQFLDFDQGKTFRKKPKNRRPQQDLDVTRRSTLSIRLFLRDFCVEFLNSAYNSLMFSVKDNLSRQRAQAHDETYYLWAMRFFMEFNRLYAFNVSFVSETVSIQVFHYIHTQLEKYYEMMMTDKRKMTLWSRRIHLALKAYQELLMTLAVMDKSQEEAVQKSAKIMKGNMFYMVEYRDLLLTLLMHYDEIKLSRSYLKDLVETTHVFLRMLEHQSHNNSHLIIQNKKKRSRKNKNKKKAKSDIIKSQQPSEDQLEKQWEDVSVDLSAVLRGDRTITGDVTPFDAASEKSLEDQKGDAVKKIQRALQENNAADSVALYRAARELWPEGNVFGTSNMKPEEEFMALREIFFTSIPGSAIQNMERTAEETDDESEEEDDAQTRVVVTEQEFSFNDFIKRFATTKVVQSYVTLLSDYQKNTPHTNHCIVKMLHRIAWDCRMYGLLFQASAFRIFQNILHDPQRHEASSVKELARFAKFVVEKFFECAQKNKKVFMEMLFWKSSREVYEIQEGYGSFDKKQSARVLWTEEQEDELRGLYEQYKDVREGDKDVADLIVDNLIDDTKTRRQVIRHLKHLELITDMKELCHKSTRTRVLIDWREEEEAELRQLYSQFRDATDILGRILENLTVKRPRHRVVEKMLQMGLVNDRQQLRKKRVRKTGDKKQRKSKSKSEANDSDNDEKEVEEEFFQDKVESESEIESQDVVGSYETVDSSNFKDLLLKVLESGLEPGLQWLKLSLESAIEDREDEYDDELQAVPVVPLTEDHHQALTSKDFCKLMKSVGICSPANEQETFWRIPINLNVRMLRTRVNVLNNAISGDFTSSDSLGSTKKLNPRYQMLSDLAKSKEASREVRADNVAGLQDERKCTKTSSKEISSDGRNKLKRSLEESSDEETTCSESVEPFKGSDRLTSSRSSFNDSRTNESNLRSGLQERPSKKRRVVRLEEESDDDDVPLLYVSQVRREDEEKHVANELINASITNVLNSDSHEDSDSDIGKIASHKKLKKHLIESDDDE